VAGLSGTRDSFWAATVAAGVQDHAPLAGDLEVDVAIVGGGIVGLTSAHLLQRAGKRVAVLEARKIGRQVTGRSTAKVTSQHGLIYQRLARDFGDEGARMYGAANQAALDRIAALAREVECDFEPAAAYVYARSDAEAAKVRAEAEVAQRLGLPASFVSETPLPFPVSGAIRFDDQGQFNPCKYVIGLARIVAADGGQIFEGTRVRSIEHGEPCRVATDRGTVTARDVIDAAHMPLGRQGMFFTKAYPYAHPMLAARVDPTRAPAGMFISAGSPTHSVRTARWGEQTYLVAVGEAFKPGQPEQGMKMFGDLARLVGETFNVTSIDYYWTNEDFNSMDGMPFIGRATSGSKHLFVATGFNAWGITTGTAAAMILCDLITGRANPWAPLFDAARIKPMAGGASFVSENLGVGAHLVQGYVKARPRSIGELKPGEAAIVKHDGERLAVFRDEQGQPHAVSAICTHLRCVLGWNPADRTWDCSCHGSRFDVDGSVIHGPATVDLERRQVAGS
jgi:glycine/D-amino acid oxidase-like deaminating enzyme/nitrite reductase/ring-hydroxylating ferredoxin subunit